MKTIARLRMFFSLPDAEKGQILLIVILAMVVVLTIGLSLATRNITNLKQTSDESLSQRAFSAAEAGVQIALQGGSQGSNGPIPLNDTTYQTSVTSAAQQEFIVNNGNPLQPNEPADIWLSDYPLKADTPTNLTQWYGPLIIYYGNANETDPCRIAALEVAVLTGSTTTPVMTQYAYDQCAAGRETPNNFSAPQSAGPYTAGGKNYKYALTITIPQGSPGLVARIVPLYASAPIAVVSGQAGRSLPVQGKLIESVGSAGNTKRKIVVFQSFPKLPLELFTYTLFMPADSP